MSTLLISLILFITFWVLLYLYVTRNFNYWKNRNIPFIQPVPFLGNSAKVFALTQSLGDFTRQLYESSSAPILGFFICDDPYLLIRDPEVVKSVLIKDFSTFSNRTMTNNEKDDPIGSNLLFLMKTPEWGEIRRKVMPIFSSARLKLMYGFLKDTGEEMVKFVKEKLKESCVIDVRDVSLRYTADAISHVTYGATSNCFKNDHSEFRKVTKRALNWAILERAISTSFFFIAPNIVKWFKLKFVDDATTYFFRKIYHQVMDQRKLEKLPKNDLIEFLKRFENEHKIDKLVAQTAQFFLAGYDTSSTTISCTLFELALNKTVQNELRKEIRDVTNKNGGFTYEAIKEMNYLDMCVKETLRKYPAVPFLDRRCAEDYTLPGTDIVLEKGLPIYISSWGLHMDPKYYPNPVVYDPLRFTPENIENRPQNTYLPFGDGPRKCIGERFGWLGVKSCIAHLVLSFEIDISKETVVPLKTDKGFLLSPVGEVLLKFTQL